MKQVRRPVVRFVAVAMPHAQVALPAAFLAALAQFVHLVRSQALGAIRDLGYRFHGTVTAFQVLAG